MRSLRTDRSGTEPVNARSAQGLRLLLSVCYAPVFLAAAALLALWSVLTEPGSTPSGLVLAVLSGVCAALAAVAVTDAAMLVHRRRMTRARPWW
jgi:hypothetical protein